MIQDILSMILTLIGGVCVIMLTYFASKWYVKKIGVTGGGKHLKVVDRLLVSKSGSILIVDLEGTQYMIGVSEQNIQIMKQLEKPVAILEEKEATLSKDHFINLLKDFTHKENRDEKNDEQNT